MSTSIKSYCIILLLLYSCNAFSQKRTNIWKAQVAIGVNKPLNSGFIDGVSSKNFNLPTVNLGVQYMFKPQMGAKLDFGFNRFSNGDNSPDFKINYSRVNAQFVYDPSSSIGFIPNRIRVVGHAGPGLSFARPLNNLSQNNQTFLNFMIGGELHYGLSETMSLYGDLSYIHGFTSIGDYDPLLNGLGAFNGSVVTATIGITFSLSGCYTCN